MKNKFELVVIGATFAGIGKAVRNKDSLIIESGTIPGREYVSAFCSGIADDLPLKTPQALKLKDELLKRGILSDGRVNPAGLAAYINKYLLENGVTVLFMTEVLGIEKKEDVYEISVYSCGKQQKIWADKVVSGKLGGERAETFYNAAISGGQGKMLPEPWHEDIIFEPGAYPGEAYVKLKTNSNCGLSKARILLRNIWASRPQKYNEWKIAMFADTFEIRYVAECSFLTDFETELSEFSPLKPSASKQCYDLIVAGLGTAGSIAAITAAKNGLKVLGVERLPGMGGVYTYGMISGYYFGTKGGFYEEIDKEAAIEFENNFSSRAAAKQYVLESYAVKHGIDLVYNSAVTDVLTDGNTVQGVTYMTDGHRFDASGKFVMDCTGDGEVCALAGCEYEIGRAFDKETQPYTRMRLENSPNGVGSSPNVDFGRTDILDTEDVSRHLLSSGARFSGDGENADRFGLYLSPMLGVRDGRRIICEEMLTIKDLFAGNKTEKPLFYAYADLDKHGWDIAFEDDARCDWAVLANLGAVNISVGVPLGAMLPKGFSGILAASRCMGLDDAMSSCVRMQRNMQQAGEAAAQAVTLAVKDKVTLENVSYAKLSDKLRLSGCLNDEHNKGYVFDFPNGKQKGMPVSWLGNAKDIKAGLSTDKPGIAIWSCYLAGNKFENDLIRWLGSGNENLRKHAAFALALIGSNAGEAVLFEMLKERDGTQLSDCRKHNQLRGVMSIYAARRLRLASFTDELIGLITNEKEFERPVYKNDYLMTRYKVNGYNDIYFQFFSHSVRALLEIGNAYPKLRQRINTALHLSIKDDLYVRRIVDVEYESFEKAMAENVKKIIFDKTKDWQVI
jgi:hypothetical protein